MRAAIIVVLALFAVVATATMTPVPFKPCVSSPIMTVSGIDGTYPFVRGVQLNLTISGNLASTVTSGTYQLEVKLFGVHVFGDSGDLCKYSPTYFRCPASGAAQINVVQTIPKEAPAGQYDVVFSAKDGSNKPILCIDVNTKITIE